MRLVGIDPGVNGAVVWWDTDVKLWHYRKLGREFLDVFRPIELAMQADRVACTLELVNAGGGPNKGKNSIFTQGRNFGLIEATIGILQPYCLNRYLPREWMTLARCLRVGKDGIHVRALEFFAAVPKYAADAAILSLVSGIKTGTLQDSVFDEPELFTQLGIQHGK